MFLSKSEKHFSWLVNINEHNEHNEHKFRHGFRDTVDLMSKSGLETETALHFLFSCRLYPTIRTELVDDISVVDSSLTNYPDEKLLNILLCGSE